GREKLRLHPHARRPASHHDGVATGGTPASNGAIFQLRKPQRPVTDPRHDLRVPHQGNGRAVPVVPERPAAPLVELKAQPALHGVVSALRRGLNLRRCRLWLRSPDGTRFTPVTTSGDEAEQPGYAPPVAEWMRRGHQREDVPGGSIVRLPLIHNDEPLGVLEVVIPTGRYEGIAHDVVVVVARILAPIIGASELSQDLASEVALRTHEVEA